MRGPRHTFFASPVRLDMIRLLALSVALRYRTGELVCVRKHNLLPSARLDQAMMYRLSHRRRPWVLPLNNVLPRRLFKRPYDGLGRGRSFRYWVYTVAVHRYDDEVVLLLCLLRYGQTEDLVCVLPRQRKLDIAGCANCSDSTIFLIEQLKGELLSLRYREADASI